MRAACNIELVSQDFFDTYMVEWWLSHGSNDYRDLWLMYCMGGEL